MKWLINRLKQSPWVTVQLLIASLFINILGLASTLFVIQVYSRYLVHGIDGTLITLSSGMLLVIIIELLLRRIRYRMAMAMSVKPERVSASALFDTILHGRAGDMMKVKPAARQMVLQRHEQAVAARGPALFVSMIDVPFVVIYLIAIFAISVSVGWWVLVLLASMLLISILLGFQIKNSAFAHMGAQVEQNDAVMSASRFETVRTIGAADFLQKQWDKASSATRWWKHLMANQQDLLQSLVQSMGVLLTVVVISFGAHEVVAGDIDFGLLIGLNILAARALMMLTRPAQSIATLLQAGQASRFVDNFKSIPTENTQGAVPASFSGRISFKGVGFGYQDGSGPVIEQLNAEIPAGSFVKVSGANGAGKTTLCRLITGLLDPLRGGILADGVDIRQFDPQWWRQQVIYLPQEPEFLNATLRENLVILNPGIGEKALSDIIGLAGLRRFVDQSKDGLEMLIMEGGKQLSLGIRRRIALARAMVANGPVVIIDDPAEGLDAEGTQAIGRLLNEYSKQGRTIFVMTHMADAVKGQGVTIDLDSKPIPSVTGG